MKISKYLACACIMGAALVGFPCCSEDEPDDQDQSSANGGDDSSQTGIPAANQPVVSNPVTGLVDYYGEKWRFNYSNGKMTDGVYGHNQIFKFTSAPSFTLTETWNGDDGYDKSVYSNIQLNKNGYMTHADLYFEGSESHGNGETETWTYTGTITVTYTDDEQHISRYIMEAEVEEDGEYVGTENVEVVYTWNEDNLITSNTRYWSVDVDGETDEETTLVTYDYSSGQLNSGIYLTPVDGIDILDSYFWYAGLLGKPSKQVPVYLSIIDDYGSGTDANEYTITADYNGDATVSGLTLHNEQYNYDYSVMQFFYGGAYPDFNDYYSYQQRKAKGKARVRRHPALFLKWSNSTTLKSGL